MLNTAENNLVLGTVALSGPFPIQPAKQRKYEGLRGTADVELNAGNKCYQGRQREG